MKIDCPICGQKGYLSNEKRGNYKYNYIIHLYQENGKTKKKKHYIGKDMNQIRAEIESLISGQTTKKILGYPGGDYYTANELTQRIINLCDKKCTFVEVFGGSGYISQTINREKFTNIIYNDINDKLTTLLKLIKEKPEKLTPLLMLLPYGRSYHRFIRELYKESKNLGDLETSVLLFYGMNTSFNHSIAKSGFSYAIVPYSNEAKKYKRQIRNIFTIAEKWKDITIENLDFREVIKKYDNKETVFYLDPPFVFRSKEYYGIDFTINDLQDMAKILTQIKGKFLLKIDDKTFEFIKDILKNYKIEKSEKTLIMEKKRKEKRSKWKLILISN